MIHQRPSGAAITLPLPFSATNASIARRDAAPRAMRSAWTRRVVEPSRRAASAGCGVISVGGLRACTADCSTPVGGDEVERVGVEHERQRRGAAPARAAAAPRCRCPCPGPAASAVERRVREQLRGLAQHQLGLRVVDVGRMRRSAGRGKTLPAPSLSAARPARTAAPTIPAAPPRIADAAGQALVEIPRARRRAGRRGARGRGVRRPAASSARGVEAERASAELAAVVRARRACSSPGLRAMKVSVCVARNARTHHRAGVGVDAARDVERELGRRAARSPRSTSSAIAPASGRTRPMPNRPSTTRSKRVSAGIAFSRRPSAAFHFASAAPASCGQLRRVAGEHDVDAIEPALEVRGDLEGVAAVVARTGEDEHRAAGVAGELARELGGGEAGALHQVRPRIALQRGGFERADAVDGVERREARVHGGQEFNRVPAPPGRGQS